MLNADKPVKKKKILLFADWYEPGYKAGGPIRSCVNFAYHMRGDYDLYIFTSDRDLNDPEPYPGIPTDRWITDRSGVNLFYASPKGQGWKNILQQMKLICPDFVYLNSMFSIRFTILPLLIARVHGLGYTCMLSPRGMLRTSAVQFKRTKKKLFLTIFRGLGFSRRVHFLATDTTEEADVHRFFGPAAVTVIPNFPAALPEPPEEPQKKSGDLTVICIGRIHPIKNTDYLLDALSHVKANVRLSIIGSVEDETFWSQCREKIGRLPANVHVDYLGELPNHELPPIIARHHIFASPTKGENFGHAIFESLSLGKPVLISDQTPWVRLTGACAGWDLPLDRPDAFSDAVEQVAAFDQQEYSRWSTHARRYVEDYLTKSNIKHQYLKLFS